MNTKKIRGRIRESPTLDSKFMHTFTTHISKIHCNIIFQSELFT